MLNQLDQRLFLYLNQNLHNRVGDWFFPFITSPDHFAYIGAILVLWVLWKGDNQQRVNIVLIIFALLISDALNNTIKELVQRVRPCWALAGVRLLVGKSASYSFPSAHATNSFAVVTAITYLYRKRKWIYIPFWVAAIPIAYSRIYVGVHYPLDVISGALLGITCGTGIILLNKHYPILITEIGKRERISYTGSFILIFTLITAFRLSYIASAKHSLSPEEAQYWDWSRHLDLSYYSKPPFIAYLIRFFTMIFGQSAFSVRVGSVVLSVILAIFTWKWVKEMFGSDRIAFFTGLVLNFIPLYSAGAILMTTDTPLGLFWAGTLYALYLAIFKNQNKSWYLAGVLFGLGMLSKYTMALLAPCLLLYLLVSVEHRFWLKRSEPYLAGLIGFILFLPVIYWNYAHHWVTFRHVAGQANIPEGFVIQPKEFFNFLGSQLGVVSPLFFFGMLYGSFKKIFKEGVRMDNKLKFLLCASLPVYLFFQLKSGQGKVEANWGATAYFSWGIFLVVYFEELYRKREKLSKTASLNILIWSSILCAFVITAVMHNTNLIRKAGFDFPPRKDPTSRLVGWEQLGLQVSKVEQAMPLQQKTFIFSEQYQLTAELAFYVKGQPYTYCINLDRRMNQYDLWQGTENKNGWNAVYVTYDESKPLDARIKNSFDKVEPPLIFQVIKNDLVYNQFRIYRCFGFHGQFAGVAQPVRF